MEKVEGKDQEGKAARVEEDRLVEVEVNNRLLLRVLLRSYQKVPRPECT
jgi:hypothetical protein